MSDLPRIAGTFANFKLVKTRSVAVLEIEIPLEKADATLAALGGLPKPGAEQWVALAPLTPAAVAHDRPKPAEPADRKPLPLASKVALTIADPEFHAFLSDPRGTFAEEWDRSAGLSEDADVAEGLVKSWCGVARKRDIEGNPHSMLRWRQMYRAFQNWLGSKALAQRTGAAA